MSEHQVRPTAAVIDLLRYQGFDETDLHCLERLVSMETPRPDDETEFLIARQAGEYRTGALTAIITGAVAVVAPLVNCLIVGGERLPYWGVPLLGVALIAIGVILRLLADPARQARQLLADGEFLVGRISEVMGGGSMQREEYVSIAYRMPSGRAFGLGVQARELLGALEKGDPVVVLCSATDLETAGVLTPTRLLTIGRSYPTE